MMSDAEVLAVARALNETRRIEHVAEVLRSLDACGQYSTTNPIADPSVYGADVTLRTKQTAPMPHSFTLYILERRQPDLSAAA